MEVLLACVVVGTLLVMEYGHARGSLLIMAASASMLALVGAVGGACMS